MSEQKKLSTIPLFSVVFTLASTGIIKIILEVLLSDLHYGSYTGNLIYLLLLSSTCGIIPVVIYAFTSPPLSALLYKKEEKRSGAAASLIAIAAGTAICIAANIIITKLTALIPGVIYQRGNMNFEAPAVFILELIVYAAAPAFSEELLFRGCMLNSLRVYGSIPAILISSIAFSTVHIGVIPIMAYSFAAVIVLSFLRLKTGRLSVVVLIHFAANLIALFLPV